VQKIEFNPRYICVKNTSDHNGAAIEKFLPEFDGIWCSDQGHSLKIRKYICIDSAMKKVHNSGITIPE
jgi:hypothetical protein